MTTEYAVNFFKSMRAELKLLKNLSAAVGKQRDAMIDVDPHNLIDTDEQILTVVSQIQKLAIQKHNLLASLSQNSTARDIANELPKSLQESAHRLLEAYEQECEAISEQLKGIQSLIAMQSEWFSRDEHHTYLR